MKNKTLTENVRNMFIERFNKHNINYEGLWVGDFIDVELECLIPTLFIFGNTSQDPTLVWEVIGILFDILDTLGMSDKYDGSFEFLLVTSKTDVFDDRKDLEDF